MVTSTAREIERLLYMRREETQLDAAEWFIALTYNLLNMFRALICPSSGARGYTCVPRHYTPYAVTTQV